MADSSFDEIFKKITDNPELMTKISQIAKDSENSDIASKLPLVISAISDSIGGEGKSENLKENSNTPLGESNTGNEKSSTDFPLSITRLQDKISKNSKLLVALKPYLSKERCDIIDSIIKMSQVADLVNLIK